MKVKDVIEKYKEAINKVFTQEELKKIIENFPECEYQLINLLPLLNIQPERLSEKDASNSVCDSPNTTNK